MNNLKRIFSLGLTGAMLAGLMTVGAGAANFSDDADIKNTDAVNTMVALGVISGRDTGAFDPNGNVTRAEMAKMLCVAINGGNDPTLGANARPAYTDISGHWAAKYIEYCTAMGYVSGRGDGTFDPNASVTSTEAAKMILTAMGYKADVSGFMGIDWAINTNAQANQSGLYKELGGLNTNAPLSRDNAAQMLYNALDAKIVEESNGAYKYTTYTDKDYIYVEDANGNSISVPQSVNVDETFGHKYLTVTTYDRDGSYLSKVEKTSKGYTVTLTLAEGGTRRFEKLDKDYSSLMGEKVKVLYKDTDDVYGVYASGGAVLATGIMADVEADGTDKIKVDGKSFKLDNDQNKTMLYAFNNFGDVYDANDNDDGTCVTFDKDNLPASGGAAVKAVDLDDNGKLDHIVYTPFTVAKVTYVGPKSATIGGTSVKFEDANIYEGIAKDDYAMCVAGANTVSGDPTYTKVETISGDVSATRNNGTKFRVDGTWYTVATGYLATGSEAAASAGGTVKKAAVVNGYVYFLDCTKGVNRQDYALIKNIVASANNGMNGDQAKLLFTDGTEKVVDLDKDYTGSMQKGDLVTYEIDDGDYKLAKALTADDITGNVTDDQSGFDKVIDLNDSDAFKAEKDGKSTIIDSSNAKYRIDPEAVVFVEKTNGKYAVITGAQLARMPEDTTVTHAYADKNDSNGYETISLAYVGGDVKSNDIKYAYITSNVVNVKNDDGEYVMEFDMWDGSDTISGVRTSDTVGNGKDILTIDSVKLAKKAIISYVDDGDAIDIEKIYLIGEGKTTAEIAAITAYNGDDEFSYVTSTLDADTQYIKADGTVSSMIEIDNDTVILGVSLDPCEGVPGVEIGLATEISDEDGTLTGWYANALVLCEDGKTADLIVYCDDILEAK